MIGLTVDDVNEWPDRIRAVDADGVQQGGAAPDPPQCGDAPI